MMRCPGMAAMRRTTSFSTARITWVSCCADTEVPAGRSAVDHGCRLNCERPGGGETTGHVFLGAEVEAWRVVLIDDLVRHVIADVGTRGDAAGSEMEWLRRSSRVACSLSMSSVKSTWFWPEVV